MLADRTHAGGIGRRLGSFRFIGDTGLVVGPLVVAIVYERVGDAASVLPMSSLVAACAAATVLLVSDPMSSRARRAQA